MYKNLTLSHLRNAIREFFHGKQKPVGPSKLTYQQLRDKILNGYWYSITTGDPPYKKHDIRRTTIHTGRGGILSYIDACENLGLQNADSVAESIICHTGHGDFNMLEVSIKPKRE
jgi:hypothetical protein